VVSISTQEHLPLSVLRPEVPVRLAAVLERALHKNPELRWQSAREMSEALASALQHAGRTRTARGARREPASPPAAAIASVLHAPPPRAATPGWLWPLAALSLALIGTTLWAALRPPRNTASAAPASAAVGELVAAAEPSSLATPRADVTEAKPEPAPEAPAQAAAAPSGLASEQLAQVMQSHDAELQRCYEDAVIAALMRDSAGTPPNLQPLRLDVLLEVAAAGDVQSAEVNGDASLEMKRCMTDSIRSWRFPQAGGPTQARFPVIFQPNVVQR
jgi:hypothetical protein